MTVLQSRSWLAKRFRLLLPRAPVIAGNCRMCLVEVKPGPPKPQASCALPAAENQEIFTNTPWSRRRARGDGVSAHQPPAGLPDLRPGGECDLQDQSMALAATPPLCENKRAVEKSSWAADQDVMTRCIQCTRCVRFISEVAGQSEIGLISRAKTSRSPPISNRR